ncbi:hypothetical protein D3C80_1428880 [compost metagenome]
MRDNQHQRIIIQADAAYCQEVRHNRCFEDHRDNNGHHDDRTPAEFRLGQRISEQGGHQQGQHRTDERCGKGQKERSPQVRTVDNITPGVKCELLRP